MANKILGMHRLKNKVNRNAFDLSHRHMFTAQVGELLPVFTQWVNPNETFKIGYNGKTRTAALNTDSFTLSIVTGKQIGRASCRERVGRYV